MQLSDSFVGAYDESVKLWMEVRRQFQVRNAGERELARCQDFNLFEKRIFLQNALAQMDEEERLNYKHVWGQFWASHQR